MPFVPKSWLNSPSTSTPISAAALQDMETRLSDYTDDRVDPVESNLARVINVKQAPYSAAGDGSTDDSAAFQTAIDDAVSLGQALFVPEGTYRVAELTYASGLVIRGEGTRSTILKLTADARHDSDPTASPAILSSTSPATLLEDLVIEDVTFDGSGSTAAGAAVALLHSYNCSRVSLIRCRFLDARGYGLGLQGRPANGSVWQRGAQTDIYLEKCEFINCGAATNADGMDIKSSERVTMIDCYAERCADKGFNVRSRFLTAAGCRAINNVIGMDFNAIEGSTTTTTLNGALTDSAATVTVASVPSDWPTRGTVLIDSEHISYTAISGSTLTGCTRSAGAGAAASHLDGATVTLMDYDSFIALVGCAAEGNSSTGIAVTTTSNSNTYADVIATQSRRNGGNGLSASVSSTGKMHITVQGGHYVSNLTHGIQITTAEQATIIAPDCRSNTTDGIRFTDQAGARVIGAMCVSNGGWGIRSAGTSKGIEVDATTKLLSNTSGAITRVNDVSHRYGPLTPNTWKKETLDRRYSSSGGAALTSGRLYLTAIELEEGETFTKLGYVPSTSVVTPTNQWMALYDDDLAKIEVTNDITTTVPTAGALQSFALASTVTASYSGLYYIGLVQVAGTPSSVRGVTANNVTTNAPIIVGNSTTGLTNPASAPATADALAATSIIPYALIG